MVLNEGVRALEKIQINDSFNNIVINYIPQNFSTPNYQENELIVDKKGFKLRKKRYKSQKGEVACKRIGNKSINSIESMIQTIEH